MYVGVAEKIQEHRRNELFCRRVIGEIRPKYVGPDPKVEADVSPQRNIRIALRDSWTVDPESVNSPEWDDSDGAQAGVVRRSSSTLFSVTDVSSQKTHAAAISSSLIATSSSLHPGASSVCRR